MIATKRIRIASLFFLVLFAISVPFTANAQMTKESVPADRVYGDFVVGPGKNEVTVKPGTTETVLVTVTNRMGTTKAFSLSVEDFTGSEDPSQPIILLGNERGPYSLRDYISIDVESFTLNHDERAVIPVKITVPLDAEPGGRYGSVLVSTASLPSDEDALATSPIISRVGSLMFVTIPGEARQAGELVEFNTTNGKKFFTSGPIDVSILYRNEGNIYLNPYGIIEITNTFGKSIAEMEVKPWFAMPNSLRLRELSWNKKVMFGRYTATLSLNRGYDDIIDTQKVVFYVFPIKYMLSIFAAVFIIIFGVRFVVTRFEIKMK